MTGTTAPADSAFKAGIMHLPTEPVSSAGPYPADGTLLTNVLAAVFILLTLLFIKRIVNILPSVTRCIFWWKETLNLENSVKLQKDRNIVAALLIVPFCMLAADFRLFSPSYLDGLDNTGYFFAILASFFIYLILRSAASTLAMLAKPDRKMYASARRSSWTFFIIMATVALAGGGISAIAGFPEPVGRKIILYIIATVYLIYLIRKLQIFNNSCSLLSAILYLCGLEILPTGIAVASDIFL